MHTTKNVFFFGNAGTFRVRGGLVTHLGRIFGAGGAARQFQFGPMTRRAFAPQGSRVIRGQPGASFPGKISGRI